MTADIEQVERKMIGVEPVVTERIAAKLSRRNEPPVGPDVSFHEPFGQRRLHVSSCLLHFIRKAVLAFDQGVKGLIALEQSDVPFRVIGIRAVARAGRET